MTHLCCFGFTVDSVLPSSALDFANDSSFYIKLATFQLQ